MKVILAKSAGFCYGVRRAVALTEETAARGGCWMLGDLIHNAHVVEDGERLLVVDANGAYYNAELVGCDTRTDLAVIRVTNSGVQLTPAETASGVSEVYRRLDAQIRAALDAVTLSSLTAADAGDEYVI